MTKLSVKPGQLWHVNTRTRTAVTIMVIHCGDGKGVDIPIGSRWCVDCTTGNRFWVYDRDPWCDCEFRAATLLVDVE